MLPSGFSLGELHTVIQVAMGWEDYHLHQFHIDGQRYTELNDFDDDWGQPGVDEDVGGVWGYARSLEAAADPENDEHDSYMEWLGEDFDPECFDIAAVNAALEAEFSERAKKLAGERRTQSPP